MRIQSQVVIRQESVIIQRVYQVLDQRTETLFGAARLRKLFEQFTRARPQQQLVTKFFLKTLVRILDGTVPFIIGIA